MKKAYRFLCIRMLLLGVAALLTGCGGGGGGSSGGGGVSGTGGVIGGGAGNVAIAVQPTSVLIYETQPASFSVKASGSGALSYQWRRNGNPISGAVASSYAIAAASMADNGAAFTVTITDAGRSLTSSSAALSVKSASPSVAIQPAPQTVTAGQTGAFSVTAAGLPPLRYQWLKNGNAIAGATSAKYAITATLGDHGSLFSVLVTNGKSASVTSASAKLTVQASNLTALVISEVSTCDSDRADCWFEIYNPTPNPINLNAYQIKASSLDASTGAAVGSASFTLPSYVLPADGYVVMVGSLGNIAQRGTQSVRLRSGNKVPSWGANGFVELLGSGVTVDFVKFGNSSQQPATLGAWSGGAATALPIGPSEYGKAIVRRYPAIASVNTHTAADWTFVSFATPAGRNDVPASAQDLDGDGIPHTAKIAGGTFAGIDLYSMGAKPGRKDIFIDVAYMVSNDPGTQPRSESLQKVVDAFARHGIAVHFDTGTLFSNSFSIAKFNLDQKSHVVPYEPCVEFDESVCTSNVSYRRTIYDWKDDYMDLRRRPLFHFLLFGYSKQADGSGGSSGQAELSGNDFMVTMGNWDLSTASQISLNYLINLQAGTIMHELGHNLGLGHGGFESLNNKPNYWSVMNYLYQLQGLDGNPSGSTAYMRWKRYMSTNISPCDLANSPCGAPAQYIIDFSDGSGAPLNETRILESNNIGRGSTAGAYADWDGGGTLTVKAQIRDLNADGALTTLLDNNDWGNLILPFSRGYNGQDGNSLATSRQRLVPNMATDDRQPVAAEQAPPASLLQFIKNLH